MVRRQWKTPVLVIADDFTGANDAGSGLARAGACVNVLFDADAADAGEKADVWVISTDSRAMSPQLAAERTRQVLQGREAIILSGWIYKKIDSTLRGNPGAEIEAALLACQKQLALVVPAVPRLGRTTRNGNCYIHGKLLTETEFASDPKTPVTSANVLTRLHEQSALNGSVLTLDDVRGADLVAKLRQRRGLLVVDAECDDDIQRVMLAAAQLDEKPLLAGASGLSDALGILLADKPRAPALAIIGSMSEIAQQQILRLTTQRQVVLVDVEIAQLFQQPAWQGRQHWCEQAIAALQAGKHCIIRTCQRQAQRDEIIALCQHHQLSRQALGDQLCQFLGELTDAILCQTQPAGLYLSGGDVAIAIARQLGASGFKIDGQVAGCVPYGYLLNTYQHMLVMTKAGGFGDENTLVEVICFIEEKSSE